MRDESEPTVRTITVRVAYPYGSTVYHRADTERTPGIVVGHIVRGGEITLTMVTWGATRTDNHFEIELTRERPTFEP